jgi:hypothetical protein
MLGGRTTDGLGVRIDYVDSVMNDVPALTTGFGLIFSRVIVSLSRIRAFRIVSSDFI